MRAMRIALTIELSSEKMIISRIEALLPAMHALHALHNVNMSR